MDLDVPYGLLINIILIKSLFDWIDKVERQLVNAGCPRNSEKSNDLAYIKIRLNCYYCRIN